MALSGWRTLHIDQGMELSLHLGQVQGVREGQKYSLPLEDINLIVIESGVSLSSNLLAECLSMGVPALFCDSKRMPVGFLNSLTNHSRNSAIAHEQVIIPKYFKNKLWQCIIKQKILNQAWCLKKAGRPAWGELEALAAEVQSGDYSYKESHAARIYFPALFGDGFTRQGFRGRSAAGINLALNYAYAVVRARIAASIAEAGLLPQFGIFHKNAQNPFNLADDLIEPFRPIVDHYILKNFPSAVGDSLEKEQRALLIAVLHEELLVQKSKASLIASVGTMIESFVRAIKTGKYKDLLLPTGAVQCT